MGLEEKLPNGILLTTVEKVAGYARKSSVWPATGTSQYSARDRHSSR